MRTSRSGSRTKTAERRACKRYTTTIQPNNAPVDSLYWWSSEPAALEQMCL